MDDDWTDPLKDPDRDDLFDDHHDKDMLFSDPHNDSRGLGMGMGME